MTPQQKADALRTAFTAVSCFAMAMVMLLVGIIWVAWRGAA